MYLSATMLSAALLLNCEKCSPSSLIEIEIEIEKRDE